MLTPDKRQQVARYACDLYRDNDEKEWTTGEWLYDSTATKREGASFNPNSTTIGTVRRWLRERGLFARNRRCVMCVEGALLYALAVDPEIPDDADSQKLLGEFADDAREVADLQGWLDDVDWEGIPALNDDRFYNEADAIKLLDGMAN